MTATFYIGDVLETMAKLPAGSVDLILTSPPFLALRSYLPADHPDKAKEGGSQSTPGEFIDWLIDFAEASARVLAPHGSLCVELGDTYSNGENGGPPAGGERNQTAVGYDRKFGGSLENRTAPSSRGGTGWPLAKSLSLIPETFRLSLVYGFNPLTGRQTDRWRLRNVVRWVRPNPPVGALGDKFRPATSELMVFCKSAKRFFDLDSVRGEVSEWTKGYADRPVPISPAASASNTQSMGSGTRTSGLAHEAKPVKQQGAPPLDYWNVPLVEGEEPTRYGPDEKERQRLDAEKLRPRQRYLADGQRPGGGDKRGLPGSGDNHLGAPPLDWWEIPPGGYSGAHYACFPEQLCVRPIKSMCPPNVCNVCGEPQRRETDPVTLAVSWTDCGHDDFRPGLVLDPFVGSGTTLSVATGHGRDAIGIDLDSRNAQLARERVGFFLTVEGDEDTESVKLVEPPVLGTVAGDADDEQIIDSVGVPESAVEADG